MGVGVTVEGGSVGGTDGVIVVVGGGGGGATAGGVELEGGVDDDGKGGFRPIY